MSVLLKNNVPTILITGSEGSLAQWIIKKITDKFNVIGIDNCSRYELQHHQRNYVFLHGDICNQLWLDSVFEKYSPTYVIHCAAQIYGVVGFHKYSADILSGNVISTSSVLASCVKYKIDKIAYLSSSMVYERASTFPLVEEMVNYLPCPFTGYGLSKLFGEKLLEEYDKQHGLNYVIWRPFNIITPLERFDNEPGIAHVFADFIKKIVIDKCDSVEIFGTGNQIRCFTWIDDIANMIINTSWISETDRQAYNLGSEIPISIIDLAKLIWKRSGRTEQFMYHLIESYKDDVITRIPSSAKASKLGWQHSKSIEELVDICINETMKNNHGSFLSNI